MSEFFIASLKHTRREHEHITWWGPDWCGYTPVIGDHIGRYDEDTARKLNDGVSTLAVPVEVVDTILSPEPYYMAGVSTNILRWYDQRGPVVDNTRANWKRLIEAALPGQSQRPKPVICTRKRRSFGLDSLIGAVNRAADGGAK